MTVILLVAPSLAGMEILTLVLPVLPEAGEKVTPAISLQDAVQSVLAVTTTSAVPPSLGMVLLSPDTATYGL